MRLLVTFHSVSSALLFEAAVKAAAGAGGGLAADSAAAGAAGGRRVSCTLIPVPRSLSSSCGYAAEVTAVSAEANAAPPDKAVCAGAANAAPPDKAVPAAANTADVAEAAGRLAELLRALGIEWEAVYQPPANAAGGAYITLKRNGDG